MHYESLFSLIHSVPAQAGEATAPGTNYNRSKQNGQRFAGFWDDIRFGVRMLRKQLGFAVVAILTLGIGIGASTAMLSLVHDVLLRPLPYAHSDRLYAIWASSESTGQTKVAASGPDFEDYLDQNRSFVHLAEYIPRFTFTWTGDGEPKLVTCTSVSQDFFPMLGIRPFLGRLYEPREYTYLENDTLIVSYNFWKNQLGGDPHVIGRVIHFEGVVRQSSVCFPRCGSFSGYGCLAKAHRSSKLAIHEMARK